jgi:hypothetical protein
MCSNIITTEMYSNSSSEVYHTETYKKNHTNLRGFVNTNVPLFMSWSKKACYDDMECLCISAFFVAIFSASGFP